MCAPLDQWRQLHVSPFHLLLTYRQMLITLFWWYRYMRVYIIRAVITSGSTLLLAAEFTVCLALSLSLCPSLIPNTALSHAFAFAAAVDLNRIMKKAPHHTRISRSHGRVCPSQVRLRWSTRERLHRIPESGELRVARTRIMLYSTGMFQAASSSPPNPHQPRHQYVAVALTLSRYAPFLWIAYIGLSLHVYQVRLFALIMASYTDCILVSESWCHHT